VTLAVASGAPARSSAWALRDYQAAAVSSITAAVADGMTRSIVQLPCGGGKTAVAQVAAAKIAASVGQGATRIVVFMPTRALLAQTLRAWRAHDGRFLPVAVCSEYLDAGGQDEEGPSAADLALDAEVTTDPELLTSILRNTAEAVVVFATYASAWVVSEALASLPPVDVVVLDEVHRTAGRADKAWALPLDERALPARVRLGFTATPRVIEPGRDRVTGEPISVVSMGNTEHYGPIVHVTPFRSLITAGWLQDYEIAVIAVTDA